MWDVEELTFLIIQQVFPASFYPFSSCLDNITINLVVNNIRRVFVVVAVSCRRTYVLNKWKIAAGINGAFSQKFVTE